MPLVLTSEQLFGAEQMLLSNKEQYKTKSSIFSPNENSFRAVEIDNLPVGQIQTLALHTN